MTLENANMDLNLECLDILKFGGKIRENKFKCHLEGN
jgi:hypothetical protein